MESTYQEYDYSFNTCLLGDSNVGKTSLMSRFVDDKFTEEFNKTIFTGIGVRTLNINNNTVKLRIWDHAGQERFRPITRSAFRNIPGVIIIYDATNENSFLNVDYWIQDLDRYTSYNDCKMLVGNKCDLESERQVSYEDGEKKAKQHGMKFREATAKSSESVDTIFRELASQLLLLYSDTKITKETDKTTAKSLSEENEIVKRATCF